MKRYPAIELCVLPLLAVVFLAGPAEARRYDAITLARRILDTSGVQGGIVVQLGCGDGRLTAALRVADRYTVHALEADPAKVAAARDYIKSLGLYGPVSVEQFSGEALPFSDNLVNLIVVQEPGEVPMNEVMRVLAPGGAARFRRNDTWETIVKPWPDNIDQWTHFLHDASNNAVADDTVVGPPRSLQWLARPLWLRSHETPSGIQSPVSAGGRLFYIFDEGLIGIVDERLPDRWSLVCRDAFNGRLLWKRQLDDWGWRQWNPARWQGKDWTKLRSGRTDVPSENQRRIVAGGDRLYTTLSYRAPMSILNAATGRTITTIEQTRGASEILLSDGIVVVYKRQVTEGNDTIAPALVAIHGRTGKVLWDEQIGQIRPLALAIDNGRIIHLSGKNLIARSLKDGNEMWTSKPKLTTPRTLLAVDDVVVMQGGRFAAAYDATNGKLLWEKNKLPAIGGGEGDDLFVIDGLVWRGIISADNDGKPVRKSPNALVIGWDLRSGEEKKRIFVNNLRSPEHHHRCYRNKATARYLVSSYEGAEFLDFQADNHSQNNWVRGACKYGMVPCNGMLYAPPDQCFCQPGAKLLGFTALTAASDAAGKEVADNRRLKKGPAYGAVAAMRSGSKADWPTYRHDPARSGATPSQVASNVKISWKNTLKGTLTAPVAAAGKLFVARSDAHTLYALDMASGKEMWQFTADGRIDSPPTIYRGMTLFGSRDGSVYCLRTTDGELVWRFLAAPADRRIGAFDRLESTWPVHGSILVDNGTAYFTAGRSTYLDGGIRVYGLDPTTGEIRHKGILRGPNPFEEGARDVAFYILGANSDVLVSEGGFIYMRQKKMTPQLKEVEVEVLSSKGAQDVGLHVFSTAGLLDGSNYNRTFWMYSKRWPGFQLANQAPKAGQLLVVDDEKTYAIREFYRRNVHSTMFFPAKEGYLLFADLNTNEPQIVGEQGSRAPVKWLPQSDYPRGRGDEVRKLESEAFGLDKMIGYTRAEPPLWKQWLAVRIRAMVKAGDTVFVAGAPDVLDQKEPYAAFEARKGARLVAVSAKDGRQLSQTPLDYPPVFDGMIAAQGRLFASLRDGTVVCLTGK
ncbi:MAG: PQQ-binding-like beta-propeller repeat protein [Phycisphaerae bacterium]|nr:PQQ-binding-like beta-propeller repeat protein [Phycisphaerae bacterium]